MSSPLWPNERILEELKKFADENGQIIFSDAAWPVLRQMRDEMQAKIEELEELIYDRNLSDE
jgi:hypothetical protein